MMKTALLLTLILFVGCSNKTYKETNKKRTVVRSRYANEDSIIIKNYVLCNNLRTTGILDENEKVSVPADSIFKRFLSSFEKLSLSLAIDSTNLNHCSDEFHDNFYLNPNKVNTNELKKIAGTSSGKTILLPIIYLDNIYMREHFESFTNIEIVKDPFVKILVYILKGEGIIYRKSYYYQAKGVVTYDKYDSQNNVRQEHLDTLVAKVMEDYIKRLN